MSRPRGRVALYSHQGFVLRRVSRGEALALISDPLSGFESQEGRITKNDYQKDREGSPACLTVTDMRMIAGEYGDPKPAEQRRDGYLDPIESAHDKFDMWRVVSEIEIGIFCPWPRPGIFST